MTVDEQLKSWVKGQSLHNEVRGECCPDFSCCKPHLQAPRGVRELFFRADDDKRFEMLHGFLNKLIATECPELDVAVAGGEPAN